MPSRQSDASLSSSQLGTPISAITSICLKGIDGREIISTVHGRPAPVLPASAGLR
jgi:hypothetical protein